MSSSSSNIRRRPRTSNHAMFFFVALDKRPLDPRVLSALREEVIPPRDQNSCDLFGYFMFLCSQVFFMNVTCRVRTAVHMLNFKKLDNHDCVDYSHFVLSSCVFIFRPMFLYFFLGLALLYIHMYIYMIWIILH